MSGTSIFLNIMSKLLIQNNKVYSLVDTNYIKENREEIFLFGYCNFLPHNAKECTEPQESW